MPLTRSAIKKLRQDRKKEIENEAIRKKIRIAIKAAKKTKQEKALQEAFSLVDKGTKKNLLHQNKAARLKSSLSKLMKGGTVKADVKTITKVKKTKATTVKKAKPPVAKKS